MSRHFRATSFLALSFCALAAAGCGDPFRLTAPFQTVRDSFAIQTLTQTPASARAVWRIGEFYRFRLDSIGAQFDLGFDITASGQVLVVPARSVTVSPPGTVQAAPEVGLLVSTAAYASIDRAPETGFRSDTAVTVTKGQAVLVRTASNVCATQNTGGAVLYAKFVVDSISVPTRELFIRSTIQPSCGYRSFADGRPTF